MTSQSLDAPALDLESWTPSKEYFLTPTLVFRCGVASRLDALRDAVSQRLAEYLAAGVFRWSAVLDPTGPIRKDQIAAETEQMLGQELWQRLVDQKYVGYLPDPSRPMQVQFLVVCDAGKDISSDVIVDWLAKFAAALKSTNTGKRALYSLSLLLLGETIIDADKIQNYWPRFHLGKTAWGGMQVTEDQMMQVCQSVVVSLLTSEFTNCIESVVGKNRKSVSWIYPGASAILVDIQSTRDRFGPEVLGQFTRPLVCPYPDEKQRDLLDQAAGDKRREFQCNLLFQAADTAKQHGWDIECEPKLKTSLKWPEPQVLWGKDRKGCYLSLDSDPAKKIFGDARFWWLNEREDKLILPPAWGIFQKIWAWIKFQLRRFVNRLRRFPLPDLNDAEKLLAEDYQVLYKKVNEGMRQYVYRNFRHTGGEIEPGGYQNLLDAFKFLLERKGYTDKQLPLDPNVEWPSGPQVVRYFIGSLGDRLTQSPLFMYAGKPVGPSPLASDEAWQMAARADVAVMKDGIRRCERMRRGAFSPWGVLVGLLVAWPLLFGILILALSGLGLIVAIVISVILLPSLGLIEFLLWRLSYNRLLRDVRDKINQCLANRVLSLVARVMQDHRMRVSASLPPMQNVFAELAAAIDEENNRVSRECARLADQPGSREDGTLYWLMDYERVLGTQTLLIKKDDEKSSERLDETNASQYKWPALAGEVAYIYMDPETSGAELSWKSEAKRLANADASQNSNGRYEKAETAFLVEHAMPLFDKPKLAPTVIQELREFSDKYATLEFRPNSLSSYTLAEKFDALKEGRKWWWLYQRAHPLSGEVKNHSLLAIITVPGDAPLKSAVGQINPHWPKDALVVLSRQVNEIGCLRAVVEWI